LRIVVTGIIAVIIWGLVGFLIGGWPQALLFGFVAGPIMAGFAILPIVRESNSGRSSRRRG
jgi:Na+/citrate or Na+/malate symporter